MAAIISAHAEQTELYRQEALQLCGYLEVALQGALRDREGREKVRGLAMVEEIRGFLASQETETEHDYCTRGVNRTSPIT